MLRHALVLEDERLVRIVLVEMLEELGYRVLAAASAAEARALAARPFDVVVADAGLVGRGTTAREWQRRHGGRLGTVFVSGSPPRTLDLPLGRRAVFLPKPFTSAELGRSIASFRAHRTRRLLTTVYSVRRDRHTPPTPAGALASNERKDRPREDESYAGSGTRCGDSLCAVPGRRPRLAAVLLRQASRGATANVVAPPNLGVGLPSGND